MDLLVATHRYLDSPTHLKISDKTTQDSILQDFQYCGKGGLQNQLELVVNSHQKPKPQIIFSGQDPTKI